MTQNGESVNKHFIAAKKIAEQDEVTFRATLLAELRTGADRMNHLEHSVAGLRVIVEENKLPCADHEQLKEDTRLCRRVAEQQLSGEKLAEALRQEDPRAVVITLAGEHPFVKWGMYLVAVLVPVSVFLIYLFKSEIKSALLKLF